jgi:hypothetical protein
MKFDWGRNLHLPPGKLYDETDGRIDLLHALKDVESGHRMSGQRAPSRFQDACVHVVGGTSPRVRACVQLPSEMVVRRHSGHALSSVGRKRQFLATCLVAGSTVSRQCEPRSRGCLVARSNRPHRQPSHRRGRKLATIAPCGSGTASLRWRRSRSYWDAHQKRGGGTSR